MTREIDQNTDQAVAQPIVRMAVLLEMDFAGGPVRLWSGVGPLTWDARVFTGAGDLLGVSDIEETGEVRSVATSITLSGLPTSALPNVPEALAAERWQNRPARIWIAVFEDDGVTLAGEPVQVLRGRMDQLSYQEGETASFALTIETRLVDLERPRVRRYTSADQQAVYPDDLGFQYVETVAAGVEVDW